MAEDKKTKAPAAPAPKAEAPKEPPKWLIKTKAIIAKITTQANKVVKAPVVVKTVAFVVKMGVLGWLKILTIFSLIFFSYGIYKTVPYWKKLFKLPYITTFEDVADYQIPFNPNDKVITYNNDLLAPQHVVLITKVVVNIRASARSTANPMAAFDLYIRTDNQEAAVEIKDREKQLQDHIQRLCEDFNYDSIMTEEGKNIWKLKIKRELNLVLTTGRVKEVLFKTLIIKP